MSVNNQSINQGGNDHFRKLARIPTQQIQIVSHTICSGRSVKADLDFPDDIQRVFQRHELVEYKQFVVIMTMV